MLTNINTSETRVIKSVAKVRQVTWIVFIPHSMYGMGKVLVVTFTRPSTQDRPYSSPHSNHTKALINTLPSPNTLPCRALIEADDAHQSSFICYHFFLYLWWRQRDGNVVNKHYTRCVTHVALQDTSGSRGSKMSMETHCRGKQRNFALPSLQQLQY